MGVKFLTPAFLNIELSTFTITAPLSEKTEGDSRGKSLVCLIEKRIYFTNDMLLERRGGLSHCCLSRCVKAIIQDLKLCLPVILFPNT